MIIKGNKQQIQIQTHVSSEGVAIFWILSNRYKKVMLVENAILVPIPSFHSVYPLGLNLLHNILSFLVSSCKTQTPPAVKCCAQVGGGGWGGCMLL